MRILSRSLDKYQFHVHIKRYNISDLPLDSLSLKKWVIERFVEKEKYLDNLQIKWGFKHVKTK
jgi:lysophosphatidic acid acyltransferase/lysophosphatidylinositol acyltransferase